MKNNFLKKSNILLSTVNIFRRGVRAIQIANKFGKKAGEDEDYLDKDCLPPGCEMYTETMSSSFTGLTFSEASE